MADERLSRLMQESLDGELSPKETQEMFTLLDEDEEEAANYDRLKAVDEMLASVPMERAPERLAVTIMARLAQSLETQALARQIPEPTQQALMLSLSLVSMVMMPMMVAASWQVVYGLRSPQVLNEVVYQMIALLTMVLDSLEMLMEEAQSLVHDDPEAAALAMALVPVVLMGILDYIEENEQFPNNLLNPDQDE